MSNIQLPLYLSGASVEFDRIIPMAQRLIDTGLVRIDDRWFYSAQVWAGTDHQQPSPVAYAASCDHIVNIENARLFWLFAPERASDGASTEYGIALATKRRFGLPGVIVSGPAWSRSIFRHEPMARVFEHDSDALEHVISEALRFHQKASVP